MLVLGNDGWRFRWDLRTPQHKTFDKSQFASPDFVTAEKGSNFLVKRYKKKLIMVTKIGPFKESNWGKVFWLHVFLAP